MAVRRHGRNQPTRVLPNGVRPEPPNGSRPESPNGLNRRPAYRQTAEEARFPWADGIAVLPMRKVPPPSGQVTGRKPGTGDRRLWNRNETPRPDR